MATGIVVLVSRRVVLEDVVCPATLVISRYSGKIIDIHPSILSPQHLPYETEYHDYGDLVLMPGFVDTHVHLNEPGRTSTEGFWTGTRAAIAGGVTTIVDMPLNSIPATTSLDALQTKIDVARGQCWCDVGFLGGIIPGNIKELKPMIDAGVRGFKAFMIESGVPEFPAVQQDDIKRAFLELKDSPTMVMFHAEKIPKSISSTDGISATAPFLWPRQDWRPEYIYNNFLATRPPVFEDEAIKMLIDIAKFAPHLPIHVAHVSTAEALSILKHAQDLGINISAETCFHYLSLSAEEIPLRDTRYKSEPPIRPKPNQDKLWAAMRQLPTTKSTAKEPVDGLRWSSNLIRAARRVWSEPTKPLRRGPITTIVSDHSPCAPAAKFLPAYIPPHSTPAGIEEQVINPSEGDFFKAWGGISSVGLGLPILWTQMWHRDMLNDTLQSLSQTQAQAPLESQSTILNEKSSQDSLAPPTTANITQSWNKSTSLQHLSSWCSTNTAQLVGLGTSKGRIQPGYDADICVFDPDALYTLRTEDLLFKHKMSPYVGKKMRGRVVATFLRGRKVWDWDLRKDEDGGFVGERPEGVLLLEKRRAEIDVEGGVGAACHDNGVFGSVKGIASQISGCFNGGICSDGEIRLT